MGFKKEMLGKFVSDQKQTLTQEKAKKRQKKPPPKKKSYQKGLKQKQRENVKF